MLRPRKSPNTVPKNATYAAVLFVGRPGPDVKPLAERGSTGVGYQNINVCQGFGRLLPSVSGWECGSCCAATRGSGSDCERG